MARRPHHCTSAFPPVRLQSTLPSCLHPAPTTTICLLISTQPAPLAWGWLGPLPEFWTLPTAALCTHNCSPHPTWTILASISQPHQHPCTVSSATLSVLAATGARTLMPSHSWLAHCIPCPQQEPIATAACMRGRKPSLPPYAFSPPTPCRPLVRQLAAGPAAAPMHVWRMHAHMPAVWHLVPAAATPACLHAAM